MGYKVMLAIDGSEYSDKAVQWYVDHLFQPGHQVLLAHVTELSSFPMFGFTSQQPLQAWEHQRKEDEARTRALVSRHTDTLTKAGVKEVEFLTETGYPGSVLVDLAERSGARMLVMGTRGQGTIRRTILGSVSDYVLHHATVPVCICAHNEPPEDENIEDPMAEFLGIPTFSGLSSQQKAEEESAESDNFYKFLEEN